MFNEFMDNYTQSILIFMGINIVAAYSFFAPFKTGQVSIGQAGFMAVGAYGSAVFSQKFGLPFIISVPLAGLIAGVVGVVIGFPALRIKGIYLLLLTLGFSEIIAKECFGAVGSPRYVEYAGDIHSSGSHLLSLINDLLDVAKIEAGRRRGPDALLGAAKRFEHDEPRLAEARLCQQPRQRLGTLAV